MKSLICLFAIATAVSAFPQGGHQPQSRFLRQNNQPNTVHAAAPHQPKIAPAAAATPQHGQAAAIAPHVAPAAHVAPRRPALGPKFFGPGLNNPLAFPVNPQQVKVAEEVFRTNPNLRAIVSVNGEIEFTNQFGQDVEVVDRFGRNPLEPLDPQEEFERQQEQAQLVARIQAQKQLLANLQRFQGARFGAGSGVGAGAGVGAPNLHAASLLGFEGFEGFEDLAELGNFQNQAGGNAFFVQ